LTERNFRRKKSGAECTKNSNTYQRCTHR
jgi:hypothetical protein